MNTAKTIPSAEGQIRMICRTTESLCQNLTRITVQRTIMIRCRNPTRYHDSQTCLRCPRGADYQARIYHFLACFILTNDNGCPHYALRQMEIAPGGCTSFHNHREEHEMHFLEGEGMLRTNTGG
ncbi:MAG: hypothetical protein LUQ33_02480 [Methanoregulaceae archaeon]|nr:hypothetical protein [Methanoregulaceae archaeon]